MSFPRLFDDGQYTMDQYQNNLGLGTLIDATSCKVTEGLNGEYELELTYPLTGELFGQLQPGRIIVAKSYRNAATVQPFEIYDESRAIGGQVVFHAQHISYRALGVPIRPVTAQNAFSAVSLVASNAVISSPFTLTTDMTASGTFAMDKPASLQNVLLGSSDSLVSVYGGDILRDGYSIQLLKHRGMDRGARIVYGRNLVDLTQEKSIAEMYDSVYPFFVETDENGSTRLVELADTLVLITAPNKASAKKVYMLDLSSEFDETPNQAQMLQATNDYIAKNSLDKPKVSLSLKYVDLSRTQEYADLKNLDHIELGDDVTVQFESLGVDVTARVSKIVYDVLLDANESIDVGDVRTNVVDTIAQGGTGGVDNSQQIKKLSIKADQATQAASDAAKVATNYITEGSGGVRFFGSSSSITMGGGGLTFNGIKNRTALWTNSDITSGQSSPSDFAAQTISLDLSSYSAVLILYTTSIAAHWWSGAEDGEMTAIVLPVNGLTTTMLYPYNTLTRRNVRVSTTGVRFYGGYERWQDYNLGVINSFELDVPWKVGWHADDGCCIPCYIYGFM